MLKYDGYANYIYYEFEQCLGTYLSDQISSKLRSDESVGLSMDSSLDRAIIMIIVLKGLG